MTSSTQDNLKNIDNEEHAEYAAEDEKQLQGTVAELDTFEHKHHAIDLAFDYRGDVTIETKDGSEIQGYIFDRNYETKEPNIRVLPSDGSGKITLKTDDITKLTFSGKDTAAGKSWETWLRKWKEKHLNNTDKAEENN